MATMGLVAAFQSLNNIDLSGISWSLTAAAGAAREAAQTAKELGDAYSVAADKAKQLTDAQKIVAKNAGSSTAKSQATDYSYADLAALDDSASELVSKFNSLSGSVLDLTKTQEDYDKDLLLLAEERKQALRDIPKDYSGGGFGITLQSDIDKVNAEYDAKLNALTTKLVADKKLSAESSTEIQKIDAELAKIKAGLAAKDTEVAWGEAIGDLKDFKDELTSGKYQGVTGSDESSIKALVDQLTKAWSNNSPIKTYEINLNGVGIKTIDDPTDLINLIEQLSKSKRVAL